MIYLLVDLSDNILRKGDALIAALEIVFAAEIGVFVENDLIHIKLIQVGVKQRGDDGF